MILHRVELEPGWPHPAISPEKSGVGAPRLHSILLQDNQNHNELHDSAVRHSAICGFLPLLPMVASPSPRRASRGATTNPNPYTKWRW